MEKEFIEMAIRLRREIIDLRSRIQTLEPKAIAWDAHLKFLAYLPGQSQDMGEDIIYTIDRRIEAVQKKMKETPEEAKANEAK